MSRRMQAGSLAGVPYTVITDNTAGYTLPQLQSALLAQIWIRNPHGISLS